jgi:hypothetical protein
LAWVHENETEGGREDRIFSETFEDWSFLGFKNRLETVQYAWERMGRLFSKPEEGLVANKKREDWGLRGGGGEVGGGGLDATGMGHLIYYFYFFNFN